MKKFLTLLFVCVFLVSFSAVFSAKKAVADGAAKYDISAVTTIYEGEEVFVKGGTKYVGNKSIGYGDTVAFGYKNADSSKQLRMAFGIGYYGFYLYYNPNNPVTVMSCDMSGWARKTNLVTVPRDLFTNYNEIELCLTEKDEQNVRLTMTYADGEERKTIGCDFAKVAASDGLLRFGDMNFDGNAIKSLETLPPDTEAPVIDAPVTRFKTTEGTYPDFDYIAITDDSGVFDVTYTWSEGALDFNGRLKAGNHTCTVTATDRGDNETSVVIYFDVEEETPVEIYSVIFRVEGREDYIVEYSAETVDYITPPEVPAKQYYDAWDYTLEFVKGQVVTLVYKPTVYTVTFMADGKKVGEVRYTIENYDFNEPAVPKKGGYKGEWKPHEYSFENITVYAVYTKIEEPSGGESESSDLSGSESEGSATSGSSSGGSGCSSEVSSVAPLLTAALVAFGAVMSKRKRKE